MGELPQILVRHRCNQVQLTTYSIAVVERFHRTLKEILRLITIPENQSQFEQEVTLAIEWYNECRPHTTLGGKTPNEVYFSRPAANEQPRREPREGWPRGSPCAKPQVEKRR
jgi:transposase InsO family protein